MWGLLLCKWLMIRCVGTPCQAREGQAREGPIGLLRHAAFEQGWEPEIIAHPSNLTTSPPRLTAAGPAACTAATTGRMRCSRGP